MSLSTCAEPANEPPADFFLHEQQAAGERLLHHQCWCWGRDIWHPQGNLLIRHGFERFGVPEGKEGSNFYRLRIDERREIALWGFGVLYSSAEKGAIFIKRYEFYPKLFQTAKIDLPVFKGDQLPPRRAPRSDEEINVAAFLNAELIEWILKYESWIEKTCGKSWRVNCLKEWQNTKLSPRQIKKGWEKLHKDLRKNYEKRNSPRIPRSGI